MTHLARSVVFSLIWLAFLGATARSPLQATTKPAPAVAPADAAIMQAVINAELATPGYGKLCVDGPASFPALVYSDDEDATLQLQIKQLLDIGFIRITSSRTIADDVTQTQYDLTQAGTRLYSTYRRPGFGDDFHGWCFADYGVGRIISSESGPFCRRPSQLLTGFAEPDPRCVTIVTYLPKITFVADWIRLPQAKGFALGNELGIFSHTPMTATLAPVGDGWQAVTAAVSVVSP